MKRALVSALTLAILGCDAFSLSAEYECVGVGTFHAGEGGVRGTCRPIESGAVDAPEPVDAPTDSPLSDAASDASDATLDAETGPDATLDATLDASPDVDAEASVPDGCSPNDAGECASLAIGDLSAWSRFPSEYVNASTVGTAIRLWGDGAMYNGAAPMRYAGLVRDVPSGNGELRFRFAVRQATDRLDYHGQGWAIFQAQDFADGGYDLGAWVRTTFVAGKPATGYRVQFSKAWGDVTLVKFPGGGYVRSAQLPLAIDQEVAVSVRVVEHELIVSTGGVERFRFYDLDLDAGADTIALGVPLHARVDVWPEAYATLPRAAPSAEPARVPVFSSRPYIGGRWWLFDGAEPIAQYPQHESPQVLLWNQVKTVPGKKPQIAFGPHWETSNQGVFALAKNELTGRPVAAGGGDTIDVTWSTRQPDGRFEIRAGMTVRWDSARGSYRYEIASELEVFTQPFTFSYGFDFEHHAALHPFEWQYHVAKTVSGGFVKRPVFPIDPGVTYGLATSPGMRFWYGQHYGRGSHVPGVEYTVPQPPVRAASSAICAFYDDSGFALAQETVPAGGIVRERHAYVGLPYAEVDPIYATSTTVDLQMLDPTGTYAFPEWPTQTFSIRRRMDESWTFDLGKPWLTTPSKRSTYEVADLPEGPALKLPAGAYAKAALPITATLPAGRYLISGMVRTDAPLGPGGRVEITMGGITTTHYTGNVTAALAPFAFSITRAAGTVSGQLALAFGNAGGGVVYYRNVNIRALSAGEPDVPPAAMPAYDAPYGGAVVDYRLLEGGGSKLYDQRGSDIGFAETQRLDWVDDGGPALRFSDTPAAPPPIPRWGRIDTLLRTSPSYLGKIGIPFLLAGENSGGVSWNEVSIATWAKPDMAQPGSVAHVVGLGARKFILRLVGAASPYKLSLQTGLGPANVVESAAVVTGGAWHQLVATGELVSGTVFARLYVDGAQVASGTLTGVTMPSVVLPSVVAGGDLYYLSAPYYRGLVGRFAVWDRAIAAGELAGFSR